MAQQPKQERAIQTRKEILRAAAVVFDASGFAGASINRILAEAGVTAGALYFHFKSKEDLARAVMTAQPDSILPWLTSDGLQRLVDITLVWAHQLQTDVVLRAGVRLTSEQGSFGVRDVTPYQDWSRLMADCLRAASEKGELQAGIEPTELAEFVVEACTGMQTYSAVASEARADLVDRVVRMWRLLMPGIAVPTVIARTEVNPARAQTAVLVAASSAASSAAAVA
ncbi:ScbR family autoregulator-binding transcription factor [Streptomyces subrutilus]|uniref:Gamma-butyrolactone-binding protein n=1 Tax=Streptomyces subrutilus TaxID=36818 RepID=A0A5P2UEK7_9ACTN|nr:ScbR family autoregulator-binding transcription factor [Streptomyces subrutilus]QEU77370.1 TetR/AcrR family transcriptional regulator [Streptomyces subrutilus]WSJ33549.1 TetR/AcrR family transcriptional regulator [Streptomyces subrutilus]GGZ46933.1 gamma-butyrolactone-binding protein [Streptomyces subrutilus]